MNTVIIIEDILSTPSSWRKIETDDVVGSLVDHFGAWPQNTRIYKDIVATCNDVTPHDNETVLALQSMQGIFYVVVYPKDTSIIVGVVLLVAAVAAMFLFKPKVPTAAIRNTQSTSPNNALSSRENDARPNGRIPDIFGTIRSTPDQICVPYTQYINHQEVEDSLLCIGRGQYEIHDMKDGETSVYEIDGTTVQAYLPHTNLNTGKPYFSTGAPLTDRAMMATRSNSVNGQVLGAPNSNSFQGVNEVRCRFPNIVQSYGDTSFEGIFEAGDTIVIRGGGKYVEEAKVGLIQPYSQRSFLIPFETDQQLAQLAASVRIALPEAFFIGDGRVQGITYNLSGTYPVESVTKLTIGTADYCLVTLDSPADINKQWERVTSPDAMDAAYVNYVIHGTIIYSLDGEYSVVGVSGKQMTLSNPASVNPAWQTLQNMPLQQSDLLSPLIYAHGSKWIGPFILDSENRTHIWCNFVAPNGLYKDNGRRQYQANVSVEVEVTPVNEANQPTGPAKSYITTVIGSKIEKTTRAQTLKIKTNFIGRCSIRVRRTTARDLNFEGSVVDEVRWKDLYAMAPLPNPDFGNVTILRSRTYATAGALALKSRKLNCLVTRQLPRRISGSNFTTELYSTRNAADIFSFVCLDPYIGNRTKNEIDFDNIYNTVAEVGQYFGTPLATEFCYTFDSNNLSFEETAGMIANAVFCKAYRRGNVIRLFFEKKTDRSSLLFNHRNKLPGSETRTVTFGFDDHDGIELDYVSPVDDAIVTMYKPDSSAINPDKHESVGIRNKVQAHFHACREWNKLQYHSVTTEFDATQEANLLLVGERILVADNTQDSTQDGEITAQEGLVVHTSQPIEIKGSSPAYAFFQLPDGTVESIPVSSGPVPHSMLLARPPRIPLVIDADAYARSTYIIGNSNNDSNTMAFLVSERETKDNFTATLQAINYDDRYYANDKDYIKGLITD